MHSIFCTKITKHRTITISLKRQITLLSKQSFCRPTQLALIMAVLFYKACVILLSHPLHHNDSMVFSRFEDQKVTMQPCFPPLPLSPSPIPFGRFNFVGKPGDSTSLSNFLLITGACRSRAYFNVLL